MKKSQVEHVLRVASRICDDKEFVIIGSQSLHGKYPDMADDMMMSFKVEQTPVTLPQRHAMACLLKIIASME